MLVLVIQSTYMTENGLNATYTCKYVYVSGPTVYRHIKTRVRDRHQAKRSRLLIHSHVSRISAKACRLSLSPSRVTDKAA